MNKLTNESLVQKLLAVILNKSENQKLFIVGVSGLDASGKSKISEQIKTELEKINKNVLLVSGDSFQYPREYKEDFQEKSWALQHINRTINFESMINNFLKPIQKYPQNIKLNLLDYDSGERTDKEVKLNYPLVVIVESIYLLQPETLPYLDYKIYLEISTQTALGRAKVRPRDLSLYKNEEGIEKKYTTKNFAGYSLFLEKYNPQKFADLVIDNNDWKNPILIKEN